MRHETFRDHGDVLGLGVTIRGQSDDLTSVSDSLDLG
jgi:hypothetical protein